MPVNLESGSEDLSPSRLLGSRLKYTDFPRSFFYKAKLRTLLRQKVLGSRTGRFVIGDLTAAPFGSCVRCALVCETLCNHDALALQNREGPALS
jgi:hypothetical protein